MSESKPLWGTPSWAVEMTKQLKPSLQWVVGDYKESDVKFLGEGAYSMVVRVSDGVQDYAVKIFIPEPDSRKDKFLQNCRGAGGGEIYVGQLERICQDFLLKELRPLKQLNACRYVVPYIDSGRGQVDKELFPASVFYLVTEVKGDSLEKFLNPEETNRRRPTLTVDICLEIAIQLLRAIEYATTQVKVAGKGIIHRDLDLDNIIVKVVSREEFPSRFLQVFVLDYGIARIQEIGVPDPSKSPFPSFTRPTLPWETWYPDRPSRRFLGQ